MLKLHYVKGACSIVPRIVLEWIDVPYEINAMTEEELKSPEFLALNPMGAVPCLTEDDFAVSQTVAIIEYLDDLFPKNNILGGAGGKQKADGRRWLAIMNSDLQPAYDALFHGERMVESEEALKRLHAWARGRVGEIYDLCENRLAEREYLTGFKSAADAYLHVSLAWADKTGVDLSGRPELARFRERMAKDDGVVQATRAE